MKPRVVGVLSALLVLLVALVSFMQLQAITRQATSELQLKRSASLNRFVELATEAAAEQDFARLELEMENYSELFGEGIVADFGIQQLSTGDLEFQDHRVQEALNATRRNLERTELPIINPLGTGTELVARPFGNSSQVLGSVVMEVDPAATREKVLERWYWVVSGAAMAGLLMLALAWWVTSWVLRPINRLNAAVLDFAATGTPKKLPDGGPPELRQLGRSFSSMSAVVTESLEQQRELIAETSHQLRNPVAALRLRVDLLKMSLGEDQESASFAAVQRELHTVEQLLEDVLSLATAEHRVSEHEARTSLEGTSTESEQLVNAYELLVEQLERTAPAAREKQALLSLDPAPAAEPLISCNAFELEQMLDELLENALKYAAGQPIHAGVYVAAGTVQIQVRDEGPGMSQDELQQAGTRFWRSETQRHLEGTGLGMTIVEKLAAANGGRLELSSAHPHGLVAILSFPLLGTTGRWPRQED